MEEILEESVKDELEEAAKLIDPDDPLNEMTSKQVGEMLKNLQSMIATIQYTWEDTRKLYGLNDDQMKMLYQFNEENKDPMPEDLSDEEKEKFDHFNGLDKLTDEKITEIFGEQHSIVTFNHDVTIERIKSAVDEFFTWLKLLREYRDIHDAYIELINIEEEKNIQELREVAEKEQDPIRKEVMMKSIDNYYYNKELKFLAETQPEETINRIVEAFQDEHKVEYWIKRTRDKLNQIKVSNKFILEISQFEKRFLEEKYHKCSNILLLYFMKTIIYSNLHDKKDNDRMRTMCMIFALDSFIRGSMKEENKQIILQNIKLFLDQFVDIIPVKEKSE